MFEGAYNYAQAEAKCAEESGTLATATDQGTFDFIFDMHHAYFARYSQNAEIFLDGVYDETAAYWHCANSGGECPASMPSTIGIAFRWLNQYCVGISTSIDNGVTSLRCTDTHMVMCQFSL